MGRSLSTRVMTMAAVAAVVVGCAVCVSLSAAAAPPAPEPPGVHGAVVHQRIVPAKFNGSVRSLPKVNPAQQHGAGPRAKKDSTPSSTRGSGTARSTMQTNVGTIPGPFATPSVNFEGINSGVTPPDDNGAIGPNDYVQMVNFGFQVFDRQGNDRSGGVKAINDMWVQAGAGGVCRTNPRGDPYVIYDHLADRWLVSQLAFVNKTDPWDVCIATSQTSDPTGSWFLYDVNVGATGDYPKIGLWPTAYVLATQEGYKSGSLDVFALDRADMLNGNPILPQQFTVGGPANVFIPVDLSGPLPPGGEDPMLVRAADGGVYGGSDRVEVWNLHVDWGVPANSTLTIGTSIPVSSFDSTDCSGDDLDSFCVPQPGTTDVLDAATVWTRSGAQYRNFADHQAIVLNHTVNVGSNVTGIRWEELRAPENTPTFGLYQEGTFNPQTTTDPSKQTWRWMGSIAMDGAGDIALGYNVSNGDATNPIFAGIRYTGRLATDPLGLMPQGEQTIVNGSGTWAGQRWGDYSMMRVDPVDGCTFWYTNEYVRNNGATQGTRVAAFSFPTCHPADLAVTQTSSPSPATSGTEVDYNVTVTNNGPATANNVSLVDAIDPALTVISTSVPCGVTTGSVTCPLGTLAPGATASVLIRTLVPASYNLDNGALANLTAVASVSATELDPDTSNNTVTTTTPVRDSADLETNKLCDGTVAAGDPGNCTIYVDNHGPSAARSVVVTDHLTSGGTFTVTAASIDQGGSCTFSGAPTTNTTVSCTAPSLTAPAPAPGSRATLHITFAGNEPQTVADVATASDATSDPNTANNTATQSVPITAVSNVAITAMTAPASAVAGTSVNVTTTIKNNGPSTAQNVTVTNAYPAGTTVTGITVPPGIVCTTGTPGNPAAPASCSFGALAPGQTRTMTVQLQLSSAMPPGTLHIDAAVTSPTFDPNNTDNTAHTDTTVTTSADLALGLTGPAKYKPSTTLSYVLTVTNGGPSDAQAVTVVQTLPPLSVGSYVSNSLPAGACTIPTASNVLTCTLGTLAKGASTTYSVQFFVQGNGKTITTTATANSTTADPNSTNNNASLSIGSK